MINVNHLPISMYRNYNPYLPLNEQQKRNRKLILCRFEYLLFLFPRASVCVPITYTFLISIGNSYTNLKRSEKINPLSYRILIFLPVGNKLERTRIDL